VGGDLWDCGDIDGLQTLAAAWGLVIDPKIVERIDSLLQDAHGGRTVRLLEHHHVLAALIDARHHSSRFGFRHAGSAMSSPTNPQTTLCVAYRDNDDRVVLGIAEGGASSPTPGRGWRELQP